jgi:hypothetical protein
MDCDLHCASTGMETFTIVLEGVVDHSDSLGSSGRYGADDAQWMSAGRGIVHGEIFPLIERVGGAYHTSTECSGQSACIGLSQDSAGSFERKHASIVPAVAQSTEGGERRTTRIHHVVG